MFPEIQDTIVAASTPSGKSLCAIIKISGPEAISCIKDIFIPEFPTDLESVPPYTAVRGRICILNEHVDIPVTLYIMRKPYSYTREDVVEIHTLGSPVIIEMLLCLILSKGIQTGKNIRLPEPGEFTKRAFLHGRINLTQVEAIMRIIRAQTDRELQIAFAQLEGDISHRIKSIRDDAVSLCTYIEASIDFSDQDIELISSGEIIKKLTSIIGNIAGLLPESDAAKIPSEGIHTIFYGKPNVGKSSLINALLGRKRSIVCDIPGTTRDIVADTLEMDTIRFKLFDTAGIDDANGVVISRAMEKTRLILKNADIVLLVFDSTIDIPEQLKGLKSGNMEDITGRVIIVMNKCDLQEKNPFIELPDKLRNYPVVYTSALTGKGLDTLKKTLVNYVLMGKVNLAGDASIGSVRQREVLQHSLQLVQQAIDSAREDASPEFIALSLHAAIDKLGEIIGGITTEDILGKIFSEFCIGK